MELSGGKTFVAQAVPDLSIVMWRFYLPRLKVLWMPTEMAENSSNSKREPASRVIGRSEVRSSRARSRSVGPLSKATRRAAIAPLVW